MTGTARYCDWVGVHLGRDELRFWAMRGDVAVAEATAKGGALTTAKDYENVMLKAIEPWLGGGTTPVVVAGWPEAPLRAVPAAPLASDAVHFPTSDSRIDVHVLPGLSQAKPADFMPGPETVIGGYITRHPDFDGILVLPGSTTHWAEISAGEVVSFRSFLSMELMDILGKSANSEGFALDQTTEPDFQEAVSTTLSRPEALAAKLHEVRAELKLNDTTPDVAAARLAGYLMGAELAATRPYWLGREIVVIGTGATRSAHIAALASQSVVASEADLDEMLRAGLHAAYKARA